MDRSTPDASASGDVDLRDALGWLDEVIREALGCAAALHGPEAGGDPFRGLHITPTEVERLLGQQPGDQLLTSRDLSERARNVPLPGALGRMARAFALEAFDVAVLLIAAAPDLDLRYERYYAFLQDDVNRKRPTVDLALNLLCGGVPQKLQRRSHFAADARLVRHRLVHLVSDAAQPQAPLLAQFLKLDDQVLAALLGERSLDRRLASSCRLFTPADVSHSETLDQDTDVVLPALARRYGAAGETLLLFFQGPDGAIKQDAAERIAGALHQPILHVDLARLLAASPDFDLSLTIAFREAWLKTAILYLEDYDALRGHDHAVAHRQFLRQLAEAAGVVILAGTHAWIPQEEAPAAVIPVSFDRPGTARRIARWRQALHHHGIASAEEGLAQSLAERFQLSARQIAGAVAAAAFDARGRAETDPAHDGTPTRDDLFAAARRQTRHVLANLAVHIEPARQWADLVLPDDAIAQLHEICAQVVHRRRVLDTWGFGGKSPYGNGTNVLFAGPSGTGKTMAAEIIANELGLDLYKIDLASVVSKYIGETEKNLDKIFVAAEHANAILFFDEADALFGKRSEVRDSHDRYANLEISYLLQKMEQFEGITILATNLRQNLDDAFVRRLAFIVHFPFPDEAHRRRIWAGVWPASTPLADDVEFDVLARQLKVSGGSIKNIALAAAFLAAGDGEVVTREHVLRASHREFQKLGKSFTIVDDEQPGGTA